MNYGNEGIVESGQGIGDERLMNFGQTISVGLDGQKITNSKLQAPNKHQIPSTRREHSSL